MKDCLPSSLASFVTLRLLKPSFDPLSHLAVAYHVALHQQMPRYRRFPVVHVPRDYHRHRLLPFDQRRRLHVIPAGIHPHSGRPPVPRSPNLRFHFSTRRPPATAAISAGISRPASGRFPAGSPASIGIPRPSPRDCEAFPASRGRTPRYPRDCGAFQAFHSRIWAVSAFPRGWARNRRGIWRERGTR